MSITTTLAPDIPATEAMYRLAETLTPATVVTITLGLVDPASTTPALLALAAAAPDLLEDELGGFVETVVGRLAPTPAVDERALAWDRLTEAVEQLADLAAGPESIDGWLDEMPAGTSQEATWRQQIDGYESQRTAALAILTAVPVRVWAAA
jgi:hypothetical protein